MKEKIVNILKNPIVIGTVVVFVIMVLCGILSSKKPVAQHPEIVVEFCDTLVRYDQEDIIQLLSATDLVRFKSEKDKVIQEFNKVMATNGVKVSYTLGNVECNEVPNSTTGETEYVCHVMLIISQKGEAINALNMTFRVRNRDGKGTIVEFKCPELGVE